MESIKQFIKDAIQITFYVFLSILFIIVIPIFIYAMMGNQMKRVKIRNRRRCSPKPNHMWRATMKTMFVKVNKEI